MSYRLPKGSNDIAPGLWNAYLREEPIMERECLYCGGIYVGQECPGCGARRPAERQVEPGPIPYSHGNTWTTVSAGPWNVSNVMVVSRVVHSGGAYVGNSRTWNGERWLD